MSTTPLRKLPRLEGGYLENHYSEIKRAFPMRKLFADDPTRGERLTVEAVGLYFDYSKNRVTDETLRLLPTLGGRVRPARSHRRHVPRRQNSDITENRARPATRLFAP